MGFLSVTLQMIDFFAWPVLALGYPICASIRAIETGSKYHMRKLVTYWTIFSFISLFEHVFENLIEWVPLWPYIKLITICWLVIPEFNGACYSYQHLVHSCLPLKLHNVIAQFYGSCYVYQYCAYLCSFVNLQTFIDWFNKPMEDPSLKNETFLSVAERYLEENGSDALVKLISNKTACEGSGPVWEDIKVMEHMAKHEVAVPKQVEGVKENQIQIEKKTVGMQVEEMIVPADVEEIKLPEITSVKQVQTEWSCAVCQVTTTSEHNLKSHLNGRKHKAKCEEPKTCKQVAKSEGISPVTTKSNQLNQVQVKHAAAAQSEHNANEAADPKQAKSVKENLVQAGKKTTGVLIKETTLPADQGILAIYQGRDVESVKEIQIQIEKKTVGMQVEETIVPADVEEIKLPEITSIKQVQTEWTCAVCQVTTTSEHNLKTHLNRRKHKAKCEELKTCKQVAKSEGISPVTTKSNELQQEQVKHAAAPQSEHSANGAADPKKVKSVKENLVQAGKKTTSVPIKETTLPTDNPKEIKHRETNSLKNVQKEWTCAVCQVTTKSEHDLKCHLLGRKHREKCEELKACKKKAKTERNPPDQLKKEQVKHACSAQTSEGFGFIGYSTHTEAARAIHLGNAQFLFGKPINCSWGSKPTPPGTTSTPLPPPAMAHVPGFSTTDLANYEWQLALARMGLMHSQALTHSQGQAIYDGGYANIATIQPPMYY